MRPPTKLPRRILVIRMGAIGDVVNALVLASALKNHDPQVEIAWAVHNLSQPFVQDHPAIDRCHLWRKNTGWSGFRTFLSELRRERYDLAIDLQRLAKSSAVARLSGARRVLGYDRQRAKEQSWLLTKERIPTADVRRHMVRHYLEFAQYLGVPDPQPIFRFPAFPEAARWAQEFVAPFPDRPLLVNMGASKSARRWSPRRFGQLASQLHERTGRTVLLVGGPDELATADEARAEIRSAPGVVDMIGTATLPQLLELLRHVAVFIGGDTGPMHMAVAVGRHVVGIFGPSDASRTGPFGDTHTIIQGTRVFPSGEAYERSGWQTAEMDDVTVELVAEVAARDVETRGL